jgi:hypothetical protein
MTQSNFLSGTLLVLIACKNYSQDQEQRIQQLQEAWLQKAQEISHLSEQTIQRYNQIEATIFEVHKYLETLVKDLDDKDKDDFKKEFWASVAEFGGSLGKAFTDDVNVKGLLIKACMSNIGDQLGFDMTRIRLFKYFIERALLKKLIEKSDKCFQELAEIDHEIFSLNGELSLLF